MLLVEIKSKTLYNFFLNQEKEMVKIYDEKIKQKENEITYLQD